MHPVDVLDSRIQNLVLLAQKRNDAGVAQANLSLSVVHAFIRQALQTDGERPALKLLERVASIAADIGAIRVFLLYGVDPLKAVPVEEFRTTVALHNKRWPQIVEHVNDQRKKIRRLVQAKAQRKSGKSR